MFPGTHCSINEINMKGVQYILLGLVLLTCRISGQGNIHWHNGLQFKKEASVQLMEYQNSELAFGRYYRVLQFDHLLSNDEIQKLTRDGLEILEYIPDLHYLVSINAAGLHYRTKFNGLLATYSLSKNYKLSGQLLYGNSCIKEGNKSLVVVKYMKDVEASKIQQELIQHKIVTDRFYAYNNVFYVKVSEQELEWLSQQPWAEFLDCESAPGEPEDREGRSMHRVNMIAANTKEQLFLKGNGVKVMVRDDGFVGPHIDFQGRIHEDVRDDAGTHGDGVSGILTGAGNYDPVIEGMAPGAELYIINYQPDFLDKTLDYHLNEGVVITNTSYSNGCNMGYTIEAQVVDKQIFENPELLHVFSAGNSNGADCGYGAGNQWGNVTGGHKIGKNVLTTANLRMDGTLETSSSRGPAKDGRLKPEISARGTDELSTAPDNSTQVFGGTSAAAPGVSGVCALLYEAYKKLHNGQNPESALIKAAIMNTATDIGVPGPDYQFGFGVIDAYKAYKLISENRYQKHRILNGETQEYSIDIGNGNIFAKFMIYWAEPEASLLASKALINDLDLEVVTPSGSVYKPWVLNPTPNAVTLAEGAKPGMDTLNNFEQVFIPSPVPGKYIIRVKGKFVPSNKVDFYVLNEIEDQYVKLNYPIGGEKFNITESTQVYYNCQGGDSIKINFSADAGAHWQNFGTEPPGTRLHSIFIPNNLSSDSCQIEIIQGNKSDRSAYFTVTNGVQGFQIVKNCTDEIVLNWKRASKDSFQIFQLGDKYMDPIAVTKDTFIKLPNKDPRITKWFSISGFERSAMSRRELAINTPDTLIGCSITKDLALANSEKNPQELYSCGELLLRPYFKVINRTAQIQSGFTLHAISKNKVVENYFSASINPYDTLEVFFDSAIVISNYGVQTLTAWIEFVQDENHFNDTVFIPLTILELPEKVGVYPMLENFDGPNFPAQWLQRNEAGDSKWNVVNVKDKNNGNGNAIMFANQNSIYNSFPVNLISQTADLTNSIQPYLYVDLAVHHYATNIYFDSIRIKVRQVCGSEIKERVFLSGTSTEINTVDPTSNQNWLPTDTAWYWLAYDLSEFKGSKIVVEFEIVRGIGDRTFLDNVQVREKLAGTAAADFTINPNPGCNKKNVTFNDSSSINGKSYLWDVGLAGTPRNFNGRGPFTTKYTTEGTKRVILKIKSDSNNDAILIKDLPVVSSPTVNYNYTIVTGRTVQFNNTSVNAYTYLWDFGDGTFSSEINPLHTFDSAKIYRVKLTISNPCGTYNRSVNIDLTLTGNRETKIEDALISIYPNPTGNHVFVKCIEQILLYRLFNAEGKMVDLKSNVNAEFLDLSLQDVADGIYTINVITSNHQLIRKIEKRN